MIFIYSRRPSFSAKELQFSLKEQNLQAKRLRALTPINETDFLINWGAKNNLGLNANIVGDKLKEISLLKEGGVKVPKFSIEKVEGWLARKRRHSGGNDLIQNLEVGDFYVEKIEDILHEFRLHIFKNKSIRAGIKRAKENAHPWIRNHQHGWYMDYGAFCQERLEKKIRYMAKKAVRVLNYDFGAVDIALRENGKTIVFEVNSAPGLETLNTSRAYARAIFKLYTENNTEGQNADD